MAVCWTTSSSASGRRKKEPLLAILLTHYAAGVSKDEYTNPEPAPCPVRLDSSVISFVDAVLFEVTLELMVRRAGSEWDWLILSCPPRVAELGCLS